MSVIYEALKKLKSPPGTKTHERKTGPKIIGNIFTFPLFYLSPQGVLILVLAIFFASAMFVLGINYFRQFLPGQTELIQVVKQQDAGSAENSVKQTEEEKQSDSSGLPSEKKSEEENIFKNIPTAPPQEFTSKLGKAGRLQTPPRFLPRAIKQPQPAPESKPAGTTSARQNFRPDSIRNQAVETISDYRQTPSQSVVETGVKSIASTESKYTPEAGDARVANEAPPLRVLKSVAGKPFTDDHLLLSDQANEAGPYRIPTSLQKEPGAHQYRISPLRADVDTPLPIQDTPFPVMTQNPAIPVAEEKDTIRISNIKRTAQLTTLITELKKTMLSGRKKEIENYLEELTLLKGIDDLYVLKMKAFWHMSQHEYGLATDMLSNVLAKNKNDLEAGINMAILEIKTDRLERAKKRLDSLEEIYPDNTMIQSLQHKIW